MPGGVCGTWPAFWTVGPDWPNNGEIDIFEGVNQATNNLMSMHTSKNCTVAGSGETGTLVTNDCFVNAAGQPGNSGCGVTSAYTDSYGTGFNNGQGGVYATEWTSDAIKIWFFPRGSIPASIRAGVPDTTTFGTPAANFQGSCDINSHFADQQIVRFRPRQEAQLAFVENANKEQVFDTTFCGDYAGNVWTSGSCSTRAATCVEYVANNPSAFTDVFWSINSLNVFQQLIATASSSSSYLSSVTPVASTSSISAVPVGMGRTSTTSSEGASTSILVGGGPPDASINTDNSTSSVALSSELSTTVDVAKSSMVTSFIEPGISINSSIPSPISSVSNPGTIIAVSRDLNVSTAILSVNTLLTSSSPLPTATAAAAIETPTVRLCRRRPHKQQRSALPDPAASSPDHLQAG
ncbi:MAG: hypothetical protein M1830_008581 [Pleopsidium flavum]|nr:MAG: hypothetical protein M1830_008581 [Pleopsidium flavum]